MNRELRVLVVDDEPLARQVLREMLAEISGVSLAGEAANGFEAVKQVSALRPDLVLLDIQMPRLDGFEVLELLGPEPPAVIFVTAHDDYAVRAFEVRALDYLLKPVHPDRLLRALGRLAAEPPPAARTTYDELLRDRRQHGGPLERVLIRDGDTVHLVPLGEVTHLEAQDDYVAVHTAGRTFLKHEALGRLAEALDGRQFCRIHRRFVINLRFLDRLETLGKENRRAVLTTGLVLPVSRAGHTRLEARLDLP